MKKHLCSCLSLLVLLNCLGISSMAQSREYYQLKVYTFANSQQETRTDAYLKDALIPALHRIGVEKVGAFKLVPSDKDSLRKTYLLIPFSSLDQFASLEAKLAADATFQKQGSAYINAAHDDSPYVRIESVLLQAFSDMPEMRSPSFDTPREKRIYELRSYESATEKLYVNKVDMFNAGGEIKLFDKLGFNAVFYGEVLSGPRMPNLMYMTTFADKASRDEHWKVFSTAPEWKEMSSLPKYQKNVSKADIIFLYPTEYSDY